MQWQIHIYHPTANTATYFKTYDTMKDLFTDAHALHACGVDTDIYHVMQSGKRFQIAQRLANEPFESFEEIYVPNAM